MEEDFTIVYLDGIYDERGRWIKKIKEKKENEHQKCINRFIYGNNETPSESYKYKYTEIDMNEYAGMEINRVLNELMEDK